MMCDLLILHWTHSNIITYYVIPIHFTLNYAACAHIKWWCHHNCRYLEESRPQTPQRRPPSVAQTPEVIQVAPAQSPAALNQSASALNQSASALNQSAGSQVVAVQSEPDVSSSTVTETQMNTVSEGEWVLKSDGQLTPRGEWSVSYRGISMCESSIIW